MNGPKIKRLTVHAAAGDAVRAGALANELQRALRQLQTSGQTPPQRRMVITLALPSNTNAGAGQLAGRIAAELRRKLGQPD
jgi:hypothetical protein